MAKIIEFPSTKIQFGNKVKEEVGKYLANKPELADCLEKSLNEFFDLVAASEIKGCNFPVPEDMSEQSVDAIRSAIEKAFNQHKNIVRSLLDKIIHLESDICLLKFKLNEFLEK